MLLHLPYHVTLVFILTTLTAFVMMIMAMFLSHHEALKKRASFLSLLLLLWLVFQSTLSLNGWYIDRRSIPPHISFPLITFILLIILLFVTPIGRKFVDALSLPMLTWLHVVRIPVELCLFWLAENKQVPYSMTFKGHNFDILFGITAPVIALLYLRWKKISPTALLIWNLLGILSLLALLVTASGAAPTALQAWNFTTPNYAFLHFPFIWLPAFILPCLLLAHLKTVRHLLKN